MIQTIKDTFLKYWFVFSALAIATLYFMYDRRGRTIDKLILEAQKQLLANQLMKLHEQARQGDEKFEKSMQGYADLKRRHESLFKQLGLRWPDGPSSTNTN